MTDAFEWRGGVGDTWAQEWRRTDRMLAPIGAALVEAVVARLAGVEKPAILDVGCGAGATSLALAERLPDARITGIDLSEPLVAVARTRAPALSFEVADAGSWAPAAGRFDALVSRHGVMFFDDPVAAFSHLRTLGTPDTRLVFSCFRARAENEWVAAQRPLFERFAPETLAAPPPPVGPFALDDPARIESILASAGFASPDLAALDFDFVVGEGGDPVAEAVGFFKRIGPFAALLNALDAPRRAAATDLLAAIMASHAEGGRVAFRAAAWIVSTRAAEGKPS